MFAYYLKLALQSLDRNKPLNILIVLAIAIGIGASMTTLTVMHLLSGDPLPGRSQHLFWAQADSNPQTRGDEPSDMLDYQTATDLWGAHQAKRQALIANSNVKVQSLSGGRPPLMMKMLSTTSDFFGMFNIPFRFGGAWTPSDDFNRNRVAVISSDLNDKLFAGQDSVGKMLRVSGNGIRIIGVLAPWRPSPLFYDVRGGRFSGGDTDGFYNKPEGIFLPFSTSLDIDNGSFEPFTCWSVPKDFRHLENSSCVWIGLWVQLNANADVARYRSFLAGYATQQKELGRLKRADNTRLRTLNEWLDFNHVIPSDVKMQSIMAFGFLAICICNVVGLLLAKFLRRGGEIGVRRALGASRKAIFIQYLFEAGVIGMTGGVIGLGLTFAGLAFIRGQSLPYSDFMHVDGKMLAVTLIISLTSSLIAGVLPALRASTMSPAIQLKIS